MQVKESSARLDQSAGDGVDPAPDVLLITVRDLHALERIAFWPEI
jgi:hypothetical protein